MAAREQEEGNYRDAHRMLFEAHKELREEGAHVPQELKQARSRRGAGVGGSPPLPGGGARLPDPPPPPLLYTDAHIPQVHFGFPPHRH